MLNGIDFYPLNDTDKVFYLVVDLNNYNKQKLNVFKKEENYMIAYLMTSEFVHQRLKQIQTLFKEYKWAKYFDDDIDVVKRKTDKRFNNFSNKSIQQLKQGIINLSVCHKFY